jgi:hypothetical protein
MRFSREFLQKGAIMKKLFVIVVLLFGIAAFGQGIPGCTSDVRTGVCSKTCSVSHVAGCTAAQLNPLLLIQHMDCVTAAFRDKAASAKCEKQFDRAMQDWKERSLLY